MHRRPVELEGFISVVEAAGAVVKTVTAGDLDPSTPSGRMVARMLGAAARHEVEHAIERIMAKKAAQAAAGQYRGSGRPFGYEGKPGSGQAGVAGMVVRDSEAAEVRDAAARVLAGESVASVAADWNTRGVRTAKGGAWSGDAVRRVLVRPRNAALVEHNGRIVGPAQWPPILDETTWSGLRALLGDGRPQRQYAPRVERLLSGGVARCGWVDADGRECGRALMSAGAVRAGHRYRCVSRKHIARLAEPLDRHVEAVVVNRLSRPDAVELIGPRDDKSAQLHIRAAAVRAKLDALTEDYMADLIDRRQLSAGTERGRAELAEIEGKLAEMAAGSALVGIAGRADAAEIWAGLSMSRCRAIVAALLNVTVLPAKRGGRGGTVRFDPDSVRITPRDLAP